MYSDFEKMAHGFSEDYGSGLFYGDEEQVVGVVCPFCGEAIFFDDWDEDEPWFCCPVCLNEDEDEDDEDEYEYEDEDEETEDR